MNKGKDIFKHFCKTCNDENIVQEGDLVLAAFSGGADSVALLDLLDRFQKECGGFRIAACHYNHKLRQEADEEQRLVEQFCQDRSIRLIVGSGDVIAETKQRNISVHAAARRLRYDFLINTIVSLHEEYNVKGSALILTGHHYDDQLETVLMRLFSGSGVEGLSGIRRRLNLIGRSNTGNDINIQVFRPLIEIRRKEIEQYCKLQKLPVIVDHSNFDTRYPRNLIRHKLIGLIEKTFGDSALNGINRSAELEDLTSKLLQQEVARAFTDTLIKKSRQEITLDYHKFSAYLTILRLSILRYSAQLLITTDNRITCERIQTADQSLSSGSAGRVELGSGIMVSRSGNTIFIYKNDENGWETQTIKPGDSVEIPGFGMIETSVINTLDCQIPPHRDTQYCDLRKLNNSKYLFVRAAEAGDRIAPYGMTGVKKVSDILRENNIPSHRRNYPVICDDNAIIAIPPFRISEQYKITETSKEVIMIKFTAQVT